MKLQISLCKYLQVACAVVCVSAMSASKIVAQDAPQNDVLTPQDYAFPEARVSNDNYDVLVLAGKNIISGGEGTPGTMDTLTPEADLQRQRAFIAKNARSLQMMDEALSQPIIPPAGREDIYEDYSPLRSLARLAMQRNRVYAGDKQWQKAVDGSLEIIRMGDQTQNGSAIIGMLVGTAIQAMGRGDVWKWYDQLSAPEALAASQSLAAIDAQAAGFDAYLTEDKWLSMRYLQRMIGDGTVWKKIVNDNKEFAGLFEKPALEKLRQMSARDILNDFNRTHAEVIDIGKQPFRRDAPPPNITNPLFGAHFPIEGNNRSHYLYARNQTGNRLLITALALQAFVKDNKQYPQTLDELAPKYLQAVPIDPFSQNAPVKYKRDGDKYLLYSVGPDGIDNGGAMIPELTDEDRKDEKKLMEMTDYRKMQGDYVAGKSKL